METHGTLTSNNVPDPKIVFQKIIPQNIKDLRIKFIFPLVNCCHSVKAFQRLFIFPFFTVINFSVIPLRSDTTSSIQFNRLLQSFCSLEAHSNQLKFSVLPPSFTTICMVNWGKFETLLNNRTVFQSFPLSRPPTSQLPPECDDAMARMEYNLVYFNVLLVLWKGWKHTSWPQLARPHCTVAVVVVEGAHIRALYRIGFRCITNGTSCLGKVLTMEKKTTKKSGSEKHWNPLQNETNFRRKLWSRGGKVSLLRR